MEEFREEFPDFSKITKNGSVTWKSGSDRPKKWTPELTDEAKSNGTNPGYFFHLSQQLGLSGGTCNTILRKDLHLFPYRPTYLHELRPIDFPQRVQYFQWFLNARETNEQIE